MHSHDLVNFSVVLTKYGITQLKKILFLDGYVFPSLIDGKRNSLFGH
jgi:hypothetical protein